MITPSVQISRDALAHNVRRIQHAAVSGGKQWAPRLTAAIPAEVLTDIILPATNQASCGRIQDAEVLAACGFQHLLLTRPVIDPAAILRLGSLLEVAEITITVDHFRHAELLSHAASSLGREIGVLIEVDLGRQTTGVRPGPDAARLASAAAALAGIRVDGVYADDRGAAILAQAEQQPAFDELVTVAQHCQRTIQNDGIRCDHITAGRHCDFSVACRHERVTLVTCPPFGSVLPKANIQLDTDDCLSPAVTILSRVISRPAFEWCVIDAGTDVFGSSGMATVLSPIGARLLQASSDVATIGLTEFALDLRIGDILQLTPRYFGEFPDDFRGQIIAV